MKVTKRDGRVVDYDRNKIIVAIQKANAEVDRYEQVSEEKIDAIGVMTADSGDRIEEARGLYDELSERLKELVTNLDRLTEAEETYALLLQAERRLSSITAASTSARVFFM